MKKITDYRTYIKERSTPTTSTGCWNWNLNVDDCGYGTAGFRGKIWKTHRIAYTAFKGEIPPGICVCHSCDNPSCVNPEHLWLGTHTDNMQDMHRKGRRTYAVGEENAGSSISEETAMKIVQQLQEDVAPQKIATSLGVSKFVVSKIKARKAWNHLTEGKIFSAPKPVAKLQESDVVEIKLRLLLGEKQRLVGEIFGVKQVTISDIHRGTKWKHVDLYEVI